MSAQELKVYEILKTKFSEQEATLVIEYFENKAEQKYHEKRDVLATKQDLAEVKTDIIKWMFIFWIGQLAASFGFILLYLKK
jgi:hypothetical protein